ncbi:5'-nucleotidase [uncultured Bacteroides sp.]|uniref:5'-nucleotidase C-terminal domain-containing protein n=1 Tax=uncultured Bacteroides sp. TaxID=162156 RepID=UPI00262CCC17|nr:5'-nucleotidase [uncultured Bacteroides sp.]
MKKFCRSLIGGLLLSGAWTLGSCYSYEVTQVEGTRVAMDSTWDARPDAEAVAMLKPYKAAVDSVMGRVVGEAEMSMDSKRPEDLLSNLVADVLREAGSQVIGIPADMGLVNVGGLRSVLSAGTITYGHVYEILPFENSLCVLTLSGDVLRQLLQNIAARGGEGVSGVKMEISADGQLLDATIGGRPIDDERLYSVATIDYLAEGNDGMTALLNAQSCDCPEGATLRNLFLQYVEKQTAEGKKVASALEGRITVKAGK